MGNPQKAYEVGRISGHGDVDADVRDAMYLYLKEDLGLSEEFSRKRSIQEIERTGPKSILGEMARLGVEVAGRRVLDLGAGLGGLSEELVLQDATTFSVEPGSSWASLAERRAGRHGKPYELYKCPGEALPFDEASMDVVVSLQVLEHVQDPRKVLAEAYRVLKPGGFFYLACENYLAFKEGHYKVFWLPALPKRLGATYLRMRGRSPQFLMESVTYVTFPQVMRWTKNVGFVRCRDERIQSAVASAGASKGTLMRLAARMAAGRGILMADRAMRTFRFGIWELFYKPA